MSKGKGKKGGDDDDITKLLGRPGNSVKMGILGMPNVGKSATFNVLSELNVPSENYPFCTIDPNVAKVTVPDERFDWLCDNFKPKSEIHAALMVTDIAGLVKGAAEGAGLGNEFLSHVNAVDALYHVIRAFKGKEVEHVEGDLDAIRDLEIILQELRLKDLANMAKTKADIEKRLRVGKNTKTPEIKKLELEMDVANRVETALKEKKNLRTLKWTFKDIEYLNDFMLLSLKPQVILVNIRLTDFEELKNKFIGPVIKWAKEHMPDAKVIPYSAAWEQKYLARTPEEREEYLKTVKVKSMLPKIIHAGYEALRLKHYFTCGADEVKCWTFREGSKAPQAAGIIHSDFEQYFVCAEVMKYDDYVEAGSEAAVKAAGKYHTKGRDYVVEDGDILFFKHGQGKKK